MAKDKSSGKPSKKIMAAAFLAGGLLLVVAFFLRGERPSSLLRTPGRLSPDFTFQDRYGRMFSSHELRGSVWVADFIFTHCAGTCPLLGREMSALLKEWPHEQDFKLVSLTVDPDRDTVEVLRRYAEDFHVEDTKWRFLTGKKEDLYRVIRLGFLENVGDNAQPTKGYEFVHSSKIVLVDREGLIRGTYDIEHEGDTKLLKQDIRYLLSLSPGEKGEGFTFRPPAPAITFRVNN